MQLLSAEAQRHRLPSLPCMQGAGCGRESLNEWLPAPLVELHLSCVPGDGCDLGLHLGCDFLSGFLNCLCSVRVSEGLGVPGGVFVFQSEYGRCLSPSLSLPFPKYVPYVSVHALLTSVCVMWSETSGLKMASVFLPDQTCSCRVRTKWDKLCPISIFFCVCPPNVCKLCIFLCLPRLRERTWSGLGSGREAVRDLGLAQAFAALQGSGQGCRGRVSEAPAGRSWSLVLPPGAGVPVGVHIPLGSSTLLAERGLWLLCHPLISQPRASCCLGLYAGSSIGIFCLGPTWQHRSRSI